MACINVTNILVKNNPSPLMAPFQFQITFEALSALQEDVEWRIIYVGEGLQAQDVSTFNSAQQSYGSDAPGEIELDCVALGPIKRGALSFEFVVKPPDFYKMDPDSVLGMQAVLVTASYRGNEFIRIGYFLNNIYMNPLLRENPPYPPQLDEVARCIISDSPRVTRFPIHWDELNLELAQPELIQTDNASQTGSSLNGAVGDENNLKSQAASYGDPGSFQKLAKSVHDNNYMDDALNPEVEDVEMGL